MAKISKTNFSGKNLDLLNIDKNYKDIELSVRDFFSVKSPQAVLRFTGYSPEEVTSEMTSLLLEHDHTSSLSVLSALEAAFRIDYLQRCYLKKKDPLSRSMRAIYKNKGVKATLDDDILKSWVKETSVSARIISDLTSALSYRNWLAHGRYWMPQLGRKYDYAFLYLLASTIFNSFPFEK